MDFCDQGQESEELHRRLALERAAAGTTTRAPQLVDDSGRVVCEDCGERIPSARLVAIPTATRCRDCQQDADGRF